MENNKVNLSKFIEKAYIKGYIDNTVYNKSLASISGCVSVPGASLYGCKRIKNDFVGTKKTSAVICDKSNACKYVLYSRCMNKRAKEYIMSLIEYENNFFHVNFNNESINTKSETLDDRIVETKSETLDDRIIDKIKDLHLEIKKIENEISLYENLLSEK